MPLNWNTTKEDDALIDAIAARAVAAAPQGGGIYGGKLEVTMDIAATHLNGCPLKLAELLAADDFDFVHDIAGIRRHLNRETGELEDCFLPRFAAPAAEREPAKNRHHLGA